MFSFFVFTCYGSLKLEVTRDPTHRGLWKREKKFDLVVAFSAVTLVCSHSFAFLWPNVISEYIPSRWMMFSWWCYRHSTDVRYFYLGQVVTFVAVFYPCFVLRELFPLDPFCSSVHEENVPGVQRRSSIFKKERSQRSRKCFTGKPGEIAMKRQRRQVIPLTSTSLILQQINPSFPVFSFSFLRKGGMMACGDIYRVAKQLQGIESLTRSNVLVKMLSSSLVYRGLPWKYFKSTCSGVLRSSSFSSYSIFQSRTYHSRTGVYGFVPPDNSSSARSSGKSACDGYF